MVFSLTTEDARKKWYSALTTEEKVSWLSLASYKGVVFILYHRDSQLAFSSQLEIGCIQPLPQSRGCQDCTAIRMEKVHIHQQYLWLNQTGVEGGGGGGGGGEGCNDNLQEVEWKDEIIISD